MIPRQLPAYGRQLLKLRNAGDVPGRIGLVFADTAKDWDLERVDFNGPIHSFIGIYDAREPEWAFVGAANLLAIAAQEYRVLRYDFSVCAGVPVCIFDQSTIHGWDHGSGYPKVEWCAAEIARVSPLVCIRAGHGFLDIARLAFLDWRESAPEPERRRWPDWFSETRLHDYIGRQRQFRRYTDAILATASG
jgi:hypothetical protein